VAVASAVAVEVAAVVASAVAVVAAMAVVTLTVAVTLTEVVATEKFANNSNLIRFERDQCSSVQLTQFFSASQK